MGFRPLKQGGHWACALICAAALCLSEMPSFAQSTTTLRGKILSFSGQQLTVSTPAGDTKALLTENTVIRTEVPVDLSDIKPGMYLGTTATRQPDGTFLASEVHIFSEDQRGTGEGHRPLGSDPRSGATMTNANVERVEDVTVQEIQGRLINLKYPGGEIRVFIPPKIPIVKRVMADQTALTKGAEVSLQTARTSDGTPAAAQITVRAARR
ncbi:MAG TPA: hypothetical protein VFD87_21085 [Phototrophicaceae bacterium]|nr:hypothetical protein [Phototrophicaceae bacterium]